MILLTHHERRDLWNACVTARKRTADPKSELNAELAAYCIVMVLDPPEIHHICHYGDTDFEQAVASMALALATGGIQLVAE